MNKIFSLFRTNAKALKHSQRKLQDSIREYELLVQDTIGQATELYKCRQMAYDRLASLQYYVQRLPESPEVLRKGINRALDFASVMKEARDSELDQIKKNMLQQSKYTLSLKEFLFKTYSADKDGRTDHTKVADSVALMAIVTTFGTTTTGSVQSSSESGNSVNEVMTLIRKSPLGIMSNMVLGLLAPLTLPVVYAALTASAITATKKRLDNDQKINEVNGLIEDVENKIVWIRSVLCEIKSMISVTCSLMKTVDTSFLPPLEMSFDNGNYPQARLLTMVDTAKTLGKLSRELIIIEN